MPFAASSTPYGVRAIRPGNPAHHPNDLNRADLRFGRSFGYGVPPAARHFDSSAEMIVAALPCARAVRAEMHAAGSVAIGGIGTGAWGVGVGV